MEPGMIVFFVFVGIVVPLLLWVLEKSVRESNSEVQASGSHAYGDISEEGEVFDDE